MAEKTTVAVRFTKHLLDVRMEGFVNELGHLIVYRLKQKRTAKDAFKDFKIQWMRIPPEEECTYAIIIWGKHETLEVREVVCEIARECAAQQLSVTLDIVME
jgi:hypothetical protein